jgi:hypothetical protein
LAARHGKFIRCTLAYLYLVWELVFIISLVQLPLRSIKISMTSVQANPKPLLEQGLLCTLKSLVKRCQQDHPASLASPTDDPINERSLWYNRNLGRILEVFGSYYDHNNSKNPWGVKWIVLFLFVTGGFVTIIPSLITILWSVGRVREILFN